MGFGSGISVFLRPAYYGGIQRTGRPGTREKEIGFKKERKKERKIPGFPKPRAPTLWFGSMRTKQERKKERKKERPRFLCVESVQSPSKVRGESLCRKDGVPDPELDTLRSRCQI